MSLDLFSDVGADLPPHERFPTNEGQDVQPLVVRDLRESLDPLIITGYTSLDTLLGFLAPVRPVHTVWKRVRILFGHDPTPTQNQDFRALNYDFAADVKKYWMEQGLSIFHSARVLIVLEMLKSGLVETRISSERRRPVHAKIYVGGAAVTLGSSNFSGAGLRWQMEGNARFIRTEEPERFREAGQLAEYIWGSGKPYDLEALLKALLQEVSWEEALARACAEILEGDWAARYVAANPLGDLGPLWPAQEAGIRQALCILQNVGSVLVADATGSGKTRMGARLIRSEMQRIWRTGRIRQDAPVVVCPPNTVRQSWKKELTQCGMGSDPLSHGSLSREGGALHQDTLRAIRLAQVLAIDEAHNFLNRSSQRTQALFRNMADTVLLFTATPINQGPKDLLPLVDLLGADNFPDDVLEVLSHLWRRGDVDEAISAGEYRTLREAIQSFTVRRTKTMFNRLVDREPERYRNALGDFCRYPHHRSHLYPCRESEEDRHIARQITQECSQLRGLVRLRSCLQVTDAQRMDGWKDASYLNWRLLGARSLAAHAVMDSLRSSRMALWEHLRGTGYVRPFLTHSDTAKPDETGNVIQQLHNLAGHPPGHALEVDIPVWLTDSDEHHRACAEEIAIYKRVFTLSERLSSNRETAKVEHLASLLGKHDKILAFDRHPITLCEMQRLLEEHGCRNVVIATGSTPAARKKVNAAFALDSERGKMIALCSDAMSEGLNLQAASAVVLLDMPSVMRLAEQRVGRVDRMDSPHTTIHVYWPDDCDEFKLNAHARFFERYRCVAEMLGANMPLPHTGMVGAGQMMGEFDAAQDADATEEELEDALTPVRWLIGPEGLVPQDVYQRYCAGGTRVVASVSVVASPRPWAFLTIAGTQWGAPQWVFLDQPGACPETDLRRVSLLLRDHLSRETPPRALDLSAEAWLKTFVQRLAASEHLLLPRKKQKALDQMRTVLEHCRKGAGRSQGELRSLATELLRLLERSDSTATVDLGALAEGWLDLTRPLWKVMLGEKRRTKPVLIKHLTPKLLAQPPGVPDLKALLASLQPIMPLEKRVVAAIIGVPESESVAVSPSGRML